MNERAIRIQAEVQKVIAFGAIGLGYTLIGTLLNPSRVLKINNLTDGILQFSFDGVTDHDVLPPVSAQIYDWCANQTFTNGAAMAQGTSIWVKSITVPTAGNVYIASFYGSTL